MVLKRDVFAFAVSSSEQVVWRNGMKFEITIEIVEAAYAWI